LHSFALISRKFFTLGRSRRTKSINKSRAPAPHQHQKMWVKHTSHLFWALLVCVCVCVICACVFERAREHYSLNCWCSWTWQRIFQCGSLQPKKRKRSWTLPACHRLKHRDQEREKEICVGCAGLPIFEISYVLFVRGVWRDAHNPLSRSLPSQNQPHSRTHTFIIISYSTARPNTVNLI